jgi:hypothetical protein
VIKIKACKNCRFWYYETEKVEGGVGLKKSECRRYPPAIMETPWPMAEPDEWCGEFRSSENE